MGGILTVDVVTSRGTVRADDWSFPAQRRSDRPGDDSMEVKVTAAVEVATARNRDGSSEGAMVSRRDQVGAALRHIVRMAPRHRECLVVWKPFGLTVRLVAGGNNHAFHRRSAAHGLQQVPGSTDV